MVIGGWAGSGGFDEIEFDIELVCCCWCCCWGGVGGDEIEAGVDDWWCRRDGVGGFDDVWVGGWGIGVAERSDVGVNCVQNVGWRSVVAVVVGWNNVPNCVVVVVVAVAGVAVVVGSNIGFNLDGPKVKWWNDDWGLNWEMSSAFFSIFFSFPDAHRRRIDGIKRKRRKPANVIIKTMQNAATIVLVKIKFSNVCWLIIVFVVVVVVWKKSICSCLNNVERSFGVDLIVVESVVGARKMGITNDGCGTWTRSLNVARANVTQHISFGIEVQMCFIWSFFVSSPFLFLFFLVYVEKKTSHQNCSHFQSKTIQFEGFSSQ